MVKNLPTNAGDVRDMGSIPGLESSPGGRHGNPLQYSCLENPMDWTEEPGGLQSIGSDITAVTLHAHTPDPSVHLCVCVYVCIYELSNH